MRLWPALESYADTAVWIARVDQEALLARADELARTGPENLPLYGIPFAVKDNIDVAGMETTAACPTFAYQAARHAAVVARALDAGAILVGKTNLDQFATGLVGTRSPYGAPRCVFDAAYVSGGSSSGSGVAVAAGLVSFALGTDTAGSGRVPAAFNNIVGLKPTPGLIGTSGVVPAVRSVDCVSIFAQTVEDATAVLDHLAGADERDCYSRTSPPVELPDAPRVGILRADQAEFFGDAAAAALYCKAVDEMRELGATLVEIDYEPFRQVASLLYDGPWVAQRLAAIAPFVASHANDMDPTVGKIITGADRFSAVDAWEGEYRLRELQIAVRRTWEQIDIMLLPTTPTIYRVEDLAREPVACNSNLGYYTNFVNILDYAAISVPSGFRPDGSDKAGLPTGATLIGPAFSDAALARLAAALHARIASGRGVRTEAPLPPAPARAIPASGVVFAVAGAHLRGMALNGQLLALDGLFVAERRTAATYRLLALNGTVPPKPGLVRVAEPDGSAIVVELWHLSDAAFGRFVASLPAPMGIGKVTLDDGASVPGFICEPGAAGDAQDITSYGGWRAYREAMDRPDCAR